MKASLTQTWNMKNGTRHTLFINLWKACMTHSLQQKNGNNII